MAHFENDLADLHSLSVIGKKLALALCAAINYFLLLTVAMPKVPLQVQSQLTSFCWREHCKFCQWKWV